MGSGIVLGISLLCVLTTHLGALGYGTIEGGWWWFFLVAIYLEAFLAVCCLLGILYGDPGVVKRRIWQVAAPSCELSSAICRSRGSGES